VFKPIDEAIEAANVPLGPPSPDPRAVCGESLFVNLDLAQVDSTVKKLASKALVDPHALANDIQLQLLWAHWLHRGRQHLLEGAAPPVFFWVSLLIPTVICNEDGMLSRGGLSDLNI
jgi:hypothetical protein